MRRLIVLSLAVLFVAGVMSFGIAAEKAATMTHAGASHKVVGEVVSVDPTAMTLNVKENLKKGETKEVTFTVGEKAKVMVHGKPGSLADLKAGDSVTVKHTMKDGKETAEEIWVAKPAAAKASAAKPATPKPSTMTEKKP